MEQSKTLFKKAINTLKRCSKTLLTTLQRSSESPKHSKTLFQKALDTSRRPAGDEWLLHQKNLLARVYTYPAEE